MEFFAKVSQSIVERLTETPSLLMPHRILALVRGGQSLADVFSGGAIASVATGQNEIGGALMLAAAGAILVPRVVEWYSKYRGAERVEQERDRASIDKYLMEKAQQAAEAKAAAHVLEEQMARNKVQAEATIRELTARIEAMDQRVSQNAEDLAAVAKSSKDEFPAAPPAVPSSVLVPDDPKHRRPAPPQPRPDGH